MVSHNQQKSANPWIGRAIKMKVFLIFSAQNKSGNKNLKAHHFPLGRKHMGI
jgi:hypothetical protein